MLHIISQYKALLEAFIISKVLSEGAQVAVEDITDVNIDYITKSEWDKILSRNSTKDLQSAIKKLTDDGVDIKVINKESRDSLKTLILATNKAKEEVKEKAVVEKEILLKETDYINKETVNTEGKFETDDNDKTEEEYIKTKEKFGYIHDTWGNKIRGAELKENVNVDSLNKLLLQTNGDYLKTFLNKLVEIANSNNLKKIPAKKEGEKDKYIYDLNFYDIDELKAEFNNIGYEADGFFGGEELGSLFQIIENVVKTQELISTLGFKEKIKIIFDYNIDGILDDGVHFYTEEKEMFEAVRSEEEFNNLLVNLGYKGLDDFNSKFSKNYFLTRKEFKTRLATVLDSKLNINPAEMLDSPDAISENIDIYNTVLENIENNAKFKEIKAKDKSLAEKIKYEGIAVIIGSVKGLAVSYDISEATNELIDSIQFGVVNGTLGFGLSKRIINQNDGTFMLDLGAVNFIPYVAATSKIYETKLEEFTDLFPNKIEDGVEVTVGGVISVIGMGAVGVDLSNLNENTANGMEKMRDNMSLTLDKLFDFIKENKSFEDTGINDTEVNRNVFNRLSELYPSFGEIGLNFLKEGALNNYLRELYNNAEGFHFTGISIGIAKAISYLVPFMGIHGEYHSTEWVQTQEANEGEVKGISSKQTINNEQVVINKQPAFSNSVETETYNIELIEAVNNLDNTITKNTRTNKFAYEIMDPNASLDSKWKGFINFANREQRFSVELNTTINSFKKVLDGAKKDGFSTNEKWYILSTVIQLMKKSNDAREGNLDAYNKDYEKIVQMNIERRKNFNNLLGFDATSISREYDNKLLSAGVKGNISEVTLKGISFDAAASKNVGLDRKTINGIDIFYSNLQMLSNGENPILIPVTNKSDIGGFINKLKNLHSLSDEKKDELIQGIESGNIELNYYRDPDGFDDRIILLNNDKVLVPGIVGSNTDTGDIAKKSNDKTNPQRKISVYKPKFDTDKYGILLGLDKRDDKNEISDTNGANGSGDTDGGGGTAAEPPAPPPPPPVIP